jgi:hypothetical protein
MLAETLAETLARLDLDGRRPACSVIPGAPAPRCGFPATASARAIAPGVRRRADVQKRTPS